MYYIYHIPGEKIGCTKRYPYRPASQSDNYELLETHDDIMIASKREKTLNLEYGYSWSDTQYYFKMVENGVLGNIKRTYTKDQFDKMIETRRANGNMSNGGAASATTDESINNAVRLDRSKGMTQEQLAKKYNLGRSVIRRIIK